MVQHLKDITKSLLLKKNLKNEELLEILSKEYHFPFVDSSTKLTVIDYTKITQYSKDGYFVFKDGNHKTCYAINKLSYLQNLPNLPSKIKEVFLVRKGEFFNILDRDFSTINLTKSILYLDFLSPNITAKSINYSKMVTGFFVLFISSLFCFTSFFHIVNTLSCFLHNLLKFILFKKSVSKNINQTYYNNYSGNYPIYTILIPLYREVAKIESILQAIEKINYPRSKLDVKFIIEADDLIMREALELFNLPDYIHLIKVPYLLPRTKPKAMNYAINYAAGEYITVYDAEDRPDPDQLIKALITFQELPDEYACVQSRLNFYNDTENLLTRLFSLEYQLWFNYLLKGLSLLDLPVTLGGTSNHFKMSALHKVGFWDSYNVTEDADLGIRLYLKGYKVHILDSKTLEESPIEIGNWLYQRSRWIKGFIQTFIVFLKTTKDYKIFSRSKVFSVYIFVGLSSYSFFSLPWLLFIGFLDLDWWIYELWIINSLFSLVVLWSTAIFAMIQGKGGVKKLSVIDWFTLLVMPLYFILHTIASYMALWECVADPFRWNKTRHGVSDHKSHY
jgi:cellulose synthase/poly-beta-1,6-N-acetylglucosamine synthase-like glycosyltransferase